MGQSSYGVVNNRPLQSVPVRLYGTAGTVIKTGYITAYRISETETAGVLPGGTTAPGTGETRSDTGSFAEYVVEQPSITNIEHIAGVVTDTGINNVIPTSGYMDIWILPLSEANAAGVEVWTDQSITVGDLLGAQPGSWAAKRGVLFGNPLLRSIQTVDRSSTAGTVRGTWAPTVLETEFLRKHTCVFEGFEHLNYSSATSLTAVSTSTATAATTLSVALDWAAVLGTSGTVAATAGNGGIVTLTPTATTDNAAVVLSKAASFCATSGQALLFDALITPTEHNTDDMNLCVGLVDSGLSLSATVPLQNDGAGPPADYDGALFFKVDGGTVWQAETSNSTSSGTQSTDTDCGAFATATAYRLRCLYDGNSSWYFWIGTTLVHSVTSTSAAPLTSAFLLPVIKVKSGSGTGTPALAAQRFNVVQAKANSGF